MAKLTRTPLICAGSLLAVGAALGCSSAGGAPGDVQNEEATGEVVASVTAIPSDGICLVITFTAGVATSYNALAAGASTASISLGKLPAGAITITPKAYNVVSGSCNSTGVTSSTVPTWVGAATTATVVPGLTTQVPLLLRPNTVVTSPVDFSPVVTQIAMGLWTSYALLSDTTVRAWGYGSNGQIGNNTTTTTNPTPVSTAASAIIALAGGGSLASHMCAINNATTGNNLYCWGYNSNGQLGANGNTSALIPLAVTGTNNYSAAVAGGSNTWALLRSSSGLWAWGANGNGQFGNGTTTPSSVPVNVGAVSEQIGGSSDHVIIRSSRNVWAAGFNNYGQLGTGNTTNSSYITGTYFATGAWPTSVSAGGNHACAVVTPNGAVQCAGYNGYGQLGDGTTTNRSTPVTVSNLSGAVSVSCGNNHTCVIKSDGTLWCWGSNFAGGLGDGTSTDRLVPVQVVGITDAKSVATSDGTTCALRSDATVWCWGYNSYGQVGDGTTFMRSVPTKILL